MEEQTDRNPDPLKEPRNNHITLKVAVIMPSILCKNLAQNLETKASKVS
jgi:hypothetical protein